MIWSWGKPNFISRKYVICFLLTSRKQSQVSGYRLNKNNNFTKPEACIYWSFILADHSPSRSAGHRISWGTAGRELSQSLLLLGKVWESSYKSQCCAKHLPSGQPYKPALLLLFLIYRWGNRMKDTDRFAQVHKVLMIPKDSRCLGSHKNWVWLLVSPFINCGSSFELKCLCPRFFICETGPLK
jgi:hypothetical protein